MASYKDLEKGFKSTVSDIEGGAKYYTSPEGLSDIVSNTANTMTLGAGEVVPGLKTETEDMLKDPVGEAYNYGTEVVKGQMDLYAPGLYDKIQGGLRDLDGSSDLGTDINEEDLDETEEKIDLLAEEAADIAEEGVEFQKEYFDALEDMVGPLMSDVGDYYQDLTGEKLTNERLEAIQLEYQKADKLSEQQLAQRGLDSSGITAQNTTLGNYDLARAKAFARSSSESDVMAEKAGFLGMGLNAMQGAAGLVQGATGQQLNSMGQFGNIYGSIYGNQMQGMIAQQQMAYNAQAANSNMWGSLGGAIGTGAGFAVGGPVGGLMGGGAGKFLGSSLASY